MSRRPPPLSPAAERALLVLAPPCRYPLSALAPVGVELDHLLELGRHDLALGVGFWHLTPPGIRLRERLLAEGRGARR